MGKIALLGLTAAAALALALPAGAAPPVTQTFTIPVSGLESCNGFDLVFVGEVTVRETVFFDASGNPVTVRLHVHGAETDTNSVTGKTIEVRGDVTITIDLATGTFTETGLSLMSNAPGEGVVIHDSGKVVFDADGEIVFQAGPHDVLDDPETWCNALS